MISDRQIDEIIEKNDIVSVISEYVKLERKGNSYKGLCPFHKEKTPSFSVLEDRQIFKCFGCGKGGNVVHFIMQAEGLSYPDALKYLAERQGIQITDTADRRAAELADKRKLIMQINKETARFFFMQLTRSREGYEYFTKRGIPPEMVKHFGLGFAPDSWDSLIKYMAAKNITGEQLEMAGLVIRNKNGGYLDKFRHKVMFPIFDVLGNVVAFGGRVLDNSKPKYINSPETALYTKGKHLYGLNFARQSGSKRVIIVEGYMDCIALHQRGITWAVAALGTALTTEQARLLKKYFNDCVTCFDADAAGQSATLRGMDILTKAGFNVRVMAVPDGKDPDEFLKKHSPEEFIKVADSAKTLVEYKISLAQQNFSPEDNGSRVKFLGAVTEVLASIEDAVERDMYTVWVSREYGISTEPLKEQIKRLRAGGKLDTRNIFMKRAVSADKRPQESVSAGKMTEKERKIDLFEKTLILLAADDSRCLEKIKIQIKEDFFTQKSNRELYRYLLNRAEGGQAVSKEILLSGVGVTDAEVLTKLLSNWISPPDIDKACSELIAKLEKVQNENRLAQIYALLANPDTDVKEKEVLTKEMNKILLEKRSK